MLSKFRKSEQGFTLIELLIVVAIIGILAAVAIPQFSQYRIRGYNAAANSDIKNFRMAEEALFGDYQTYGHTDVNLVDPLPAILTALGGPYAVTVGEIVAGPVTGATSVTGGAYIAGGREPDGAAVGSGFGLSNRVRLAADTLAATSGLGMGSYMVVAKHTQADRVFASESENTAIFFVQKGVWVNTNLEDADHTLPDSTINNDFGNVDAPVAGGGEAPNQNWTAL